MNISALTNSPNLDNLTKKSSNDEIRAVAKQFEAIMLTQLTSALSGSDSDEDSLFGSDGGSGLAKQMFAEQMAKTMAESGGIGLADLIMQKFEAQGKSAESGKFSNAIDAVREIKGGISLENFKGDVSVFEVVSTYEDQMKADIANGLIKDPVAEFPAVKSAIADVRGLDISKLGGKLTEVAYEMPLTGRISSEFGNRFHPIDKKTKFHSGLDIAVPRGTPISAAADGVVTFAGKKGGYGTVVILEHADGRTTFYAHCDKLLVEKGDTVSAGFEIAKAGSTGKSTGPHLHFEVRENGKPIDPLKFLSNVLPDRAEK